MEASAEQMLRLYTLMVRSRSTVGRLPYHIHPPPYAFAHRDALVGPVIMEARDSIESRGVTPRFKWMTRGH